MTGERRRFVPYWQPPDNPVSDERHIMLRIFAHEIAASPGETPESLARRLLTRLDLRGWGPGQTPSQQPGRTSRGRRAICPVHLDELPCRGCRADAKASSSDDG